MKKYYLICAELSGIFMADCTGAYWDSRKKRLLSATNLETAKSEGKKIFLENRELLLSYVDNRFTLEKKIELENDLPKKMKIIEEIEHIVSI